jgi:hypothetical protein
LFDAQCKERTDEGQKRSRIRRSASIVDSIATDRAVACVPRHGASPLPSQRERSPGVVNGRGGDQNGGVGAWADVEHEAPEVTQFAERLWPGVVALGRGTVVPADTPCFAIAYLATVRSDGAPRLHPFCPILAGGRLFAAIPRSSPKGEDLRRDPRCVIHAMPGPEDDELCLRAVATEVTADPKTTSLVTQVVSHSGVGGMIESVSHDAIFEFDLQQVDVAWWVDIGQPGTHAIRKQWRAT